MRITRFVTLATVAGLMSFLADSAAGVEKPGPLPQRLAEAKTIFVTCAGGACEADVYEPAFKTLTI